MYTNRAPYSRRNAFLSTLFLLCLSSHHRIENGQSKTKWRWIFSYTQHMYNIYTTYELLSKSIAWYLKMCIAWSTSFEPFFSLFDSIFNTKKYAPASDEQSWLSRAILWRWILIYLILKPNLFSTHRFKIKTLCIFKESLKKNYLNICFCRWINEFRFFTQF